VEARRLIRWGALVGTTTVAIAGALTVIAAVAIALPTMEPSPNVTCHRVASPTGSDVAAGTPTAPYRTAPHLVASLGPGQTGCLRAGTYQSEETAIRTPGVTLTSYPGERATLVGVLWVASSATGTIVSDLDLNGWSSNHDSPSPQIYARDVTFLRNDVSNDNSAICFDLGLPGWGRAQSVLIEGNDIHNCGKLPASGHDHGIYLALSDNVVIRNNWIHHNADYGIHFYPDAHNTTVVGNVIDSNGAGILFAGEGGMASSDNLVEHNLITNSLRRHNVESSWPQEGPVGTGNIVRNNCIAGAYDWFAEADGSGIASPQWGFTASANYVLQPTYVNAALGDYRLASGSACGDVLAGAAKKKRTARAPKAR
jgi:parallel beta-helix repeat protein